MCDREGSRPAGGRQAGTQGHNPYTHVSATPLESVTPHDPSAEKISLAPVSEGRVDSSAPNTVAPASPPPQQAHCLSKHSQGNCNCILPRSCKAPRCSTFLRLLTPVRVLALRLRPSSATSPCLCSPSFPATTNLLRPSGQDRTCQTPRPRVAASKRAQSIRPGRSERGLGVN